MLYLVSPLSSRQWLWFIKKSNLTFYDHPPPCSDVKEEKTEEDDEIGLVKYEEHPCLIIDIWDSCKIGKDKFMGRGVASWDEILQHKNQILKESYPLKYHNFEKEKKKAKRQREGGAPANTNKKKNTKSKKKRPTISGTIKLRICYANLRKLRANVVILSPPRLFLHRRFVSLTWYLTVWWAKASTKRQLHSESGGRRYQIRCGGEHHYRTSWASWTGWGKKSLWCAVSLR